MNYTYTDELYHHGIKGQKWGVRRYQNEDGTYTSLGKERRRSFSERYTSGRRISYEQEALSRNRHKELISNSKEYDKLWKSNQRLMEKYKLDGDDGGGGDTDHYSERELEAASRKYYDQSVQLGEMNDEFLDEARKYAKEEIVKKYGEQGLEDIKTYDATNAIAAASIILGAYGFMAVAAFIK